MHKEYHNSLEPHFKEVVNKLYSEKFGLRVFSQLSTFNNNYEERNCFIVKTYKVIINNKTKIIKGALFI
jgi:hypothetical protein